MADAANSPTGRARPTTQTAPTQVFATALNDYRARAGQEPRPGTKPTRAPAFCTSCGHDGARLLGGRVRRGRRGRLGRGLQRGDWWFLTSLFVLPKAQARGVGARVAGARPGRCAGRGIFATAHRHVAADVEHALRAARHAAPRAAAGIRGAAEHRAGAARAAAGRRDVALDPETITVPAVPELLRRSIAPYRMPRPHRRSPRSTSGWRRRLAARPARRRP